MITITPSQSGVLDVSQVDGYATASVTFTSGPSVTPNQWFWLIMSYGEERWLIRDPGQLSEFDISYGLHAPVLKNSLERLPNGTTVTFLAYSEGSIIDQLSLQIVNSDGGSGGSEYDILDFEKESLGTISNSFLKTEFIEFNFGTYVHKEILSESGGKKLAFNVYGGNPVGAAFINKTYSTVSFDITTSSDCQVLCQSPEPLDSRWQTVLAGAPRHIEFIMKNMNTLGFYSKSTNTNPTLIVDNFKMKR